MELFWPEIELKRECGPPDGTLWGPNGLIRTFYPRWLVARGFATLCSRKGFGLLCEDSYPFIL
jgi:hypothetical protein